MTEVLDIIKFGRAPCYRCGYNGAGYYQPDTHSCAKDFHRINELMLECGDSLIAAQRIFSLEQRIRQLENEKLDIMVQALGPAQPEARAWKCPCCGHGAWKRRCARCTELVEMGP